MRNFVLGMVAALFFLALAGKAHNRPGTEHNRRHAIVYAFCHSLRPCPLGDKALSVAYCESGPNLWPYAHNGPWPPVKGQETYAGLFQFGGYARARFGFSWSPWAQARGAYRYWAVSGWEPWSCA